MEFSPRCRCQNQITDVFQIECPGIIEYQVSDSPSIRFYHQAIQKKHYLKLDFLETLCGNPDEERIKSDSPSIRSPSKRIVR